FSSTLPPPPCSPLFPYTTLFRSARFGIVFGALGAARDCLQTALDYAASREVFDRSLSSYQITQTKLADMTLELQKGYLLALHLGDRKSTRLNSSHVKISYAVFCL